MAEQVTQLYPQHNTIMFGCGVEALCEKIRGLKNREGIPIWRLVFRPSPELIHKYNITDDDYEQEHGMLERDYPKYLVRFLDPDVKSGAPIFILCAFDGSDDTELCRLDENNLRKIEELQKTIHQQEQIIAEKDETISLISSSDVFSKIKSVVEEAFKSAFISVFSKKKIGDEED